MQVNLFKNCLRNIYRYTRFNKSTSYNISKGISRGNLIAGRETKFSTFCTTTCSQTNCESKFNYNTKDYYVEQLSTSCLSQYAYYIESQGEAVIVDPMRETDAYLKLLEKRGAKLKYILETHFHADFVSGHLELSKLTGAEIVYGPNAKTEFKALIAKDGQLLPLGSINIKVFHTPGHTLESSSYVLMASEPKAMFSGDFLFLGEVGRPDLAVSKAITKEDLGGMIYDSIQRLKKEYPDDMVIFPGHGAGSACGKNISSGSSDTLKNQILTNYALNENLTKEEFVRFVSQNLPTPPSYFFHDAILNKKGAKNIEDSPVKAVTPQEFLEMIKNGDYKVIDTRDHSKSKTAFVKGSYLIPLSMQYAIWAASLLKPEDNILLITDPGQEQESIIRLLRVGYESIVAYLEGPVEKLLAALNKDQIASIENTDQDKVKDLIDSNLKNKKFEILDVREQSEWTSTGTVPTAHLVSLKDLESNISKFQKDIPIGIYCKTGGRATIASSILKKHNFNNVFVLGGYITMKEQNVPFLHN